MKAMKLNPILMDDEKFDENHIKECADTLLEAEEIKKDPKLMKKITEHLDAQKGKINSLKKLKEKAHNYSNDKMDQAKEEAEAQED